MELVSLDTQPIVDGAKYGQSKAELGANFARILGYFREDSVKALTAIEEATRARNAAALVRPAHTLKGESLQFGAEALGLLAEAIEKAARQGVEDHAFPIEIVEWVAQLKPLLTRTLAFFDGELSRPAGPVRRTAGFGRKVAV